MLWNAADVRDVTFVAIETLLENNLQNNGLPFNSCTLTFLFYVLNFPIVMYVYMYVRGILNGFVTKCTQTISSSPKYFYFSKLLDLCEMGNNWLEIFSYTTVRSTTLFFFCLLQTLNILTGCWWSPFSTNGSRFFPFGII